MPNLLGYCGYVPIVKTYNSKIWQDYELSIRVWSIIVHSKALKLRFGLKKHHGQEIGWWPQKKKLQLVMTFKKLSKKKMCFYGDNN